MRFNPFELTHEPMVCNGFASEGIYNSVAQRWRCRRVGFSELLGGARGEHNDGTSRVPRVEWRSEGSVWIETN